VAGLAAVFGSGAMTNSIDEIEGADCIFIIGSNTSITHPLIATRVIRAKARGAKVIVADPRKIPITLQADLHLRQNLGTDVALINSLMHIILKKKWQDQAFIDKRTENFEELKKVVKNYPPEKVSEITGIPVADLEKAAEYYAKAKRASILYTLGITQHTTGVNNVRSLANLAMLTGNIGKESAGLNPLRGQNNVQGACDMGALPGVYSGYQPVQDKLSAKKFEQAWETQLPTQPGMTLMEMTDAACKGLLKAMYIMGENPVVSDPDINHVKEGLKALDFLVVQDIFFSETAMFADVVLPAASFAEKEGTFTATDRRVLRVRKAIDSIGESKPDWVIISQLAQKMGSSKFNYNSVQDIMNEISRLTPSYGGISFDRLDRGEILAWPCPTQRHPGTKFLHEKTFTRGKGLFTPIDYKVPAELPDTEFPFILTTGRLVSQYHTGTITRRIISLEREAPTGFVELNPQDAQRLKIGQGEKVMVRSRRGEIEIDAFITDRVTPGVVFIPFHFAESAANQLTNRRLDPEAKIPEFKVCAVNVSKMEARQ
jgi:formate dehydrogenase alpha subunit